MYVRWVQLGTFQPLDRLHSHHGQRLPWEYPGAGAHGRRRLPAAARGARAVPLLARARGARHRPADGAGAVPELAAARPRPTSTRRSTRWAATSWSRRSREPGDPADVEVWFPPGTWVDWFTGERHRGPAVEAAVGAARAHAGLRARGRDLRPSRRSHTTPVGAAATLVLTALPRQRAASRSTTTRARASATSAARFSRTRSRSERGRGRRR